MIPSDFGRLVLKPYFISPGLAFTTSTTEKVTTLATELELYDTTTAVILGLCLVLGIPLLVVIYCGIKAFIAHKRETKITGDGSGNADENFQHPAPAPPPPRALFRRQGTIAGPFGNPAFGDDDDDEEDDGRRSGVVTPSFISTNVVPEPAFNPGQRRYQYIP